MKVGDYVVVTSKLHPDIKGKVGQIKLIRNHTNPLYEVYVPLHGYTFINVNASCTPLWGYEFKPATPADRLKERLS